MGNVEMKKLSLILALIAGGLLAFQPAQAASPGCNLEVSGGLGLGDAEINSFLGSVNLAQRGAIVGLGADCYVQQGMFQIGLLGRYNFMNVGADGPVSIDIDKMWELAVKAGLKFNEHTTLYGLAGWSGTDFDVSGIFGNTSKSPNGLMLGTGLDLALSKHTALRFEYSWHNFDKENIIGGAATASPDLHVFRVGFVVALGGAESPFAGMAIPPLDPPAAEGDPKINPRRR